MKLTNLQNAVFELFENYTTELSLFGIEQNLIYHEKQEIHRDASRM